MDRWIGHNGPLSRTKFRSSAFHQVLPLEYLPGTLSLLTYLEQEVETSRKSPLSSVDSSFTLQIWTKFGSGLWRRHCKKIHPSILMLFTEIILKLRVGFLLTDLEERSSKLQPRKCQTKNIRDWLNTNSSHCHCILKCKTNTFPYFHKYCHYSMH